MKRQRITVILVTFFILLSAGFAFYYYSLSKKMRQPELAIVGEAGQSIRPFAFLNQEGDTITNKHIKDKVVVVEYFFTTCKGICPKMNENMSKVYQAYRNDNDVIILSHTVDPQRDSVPAMKAYSLRFDADPKHWMFLTGEKQALYDQAYYSYLMTAVDERNPNIDEDFIHTQKFVLVDRQGRLRMRLDKEGKPDAYDGTNERSVAQLINDIKILEEENNP
ncbi:SCO family protein [Taibaiella koreensis]|uniref:SCO family protein n=1 Tax=Taibaiella koreensis TaxID=1268548 RepID=UPI000E5A08D5|nr:SCO family protein [Taibaiella koreensis]